MKKYLLKVKEYIEKTPSKSWKGFLNVVMFAVIPTWIVAWIVVIVITLIFLEL